MTYFFLQNCKFYEKENYMNCNLTYQEFLFKVNFQKHIGLLPIKSFTLEKQKIRYMGEI